ncbi:protein VASCULATURE COMPLEXITY AND CONNECTIVITY-like [Carex rostrata]
MNKQVLYVSLVCGFLGLLSIILGFTAEVTKIKDTDVYINIYNECYYPSSPAFGTAIVAMLLLVLAQILVTVFGGCCGCCKKDPNAPVVLGTKRTLAIVFVVISWITFAISVILFILGAMRNGTGNHTESLDNCYVVKPGIFAGAAICALFTMTFSITSYILLSPSIDAAGKPTGVQYANGIAMGTPQFPHTSQQQYQDPGMGGTQYPEPGVGGTQYPPPGTNYSTV